MAWSDVICVECCEKMGDRASVFVADQPWHVECHYREVQAQLAAAEARKQILTDEEIGLIANKMHEAFWNTPLPNPALNMDHPLAQGLRLETLEKNVLIGTIQLQKKEILELRSQLDEIRKRPTYES